MPRSKIQNQRNWKKEKYKHISSETNKQKYNKKQKTKK